MPASGFHWRVVAARLVRHDTGGVDRARETIVRIRPVDLVQAKGAYAITGANRIHWEKPGLAMRVGRSGWHGS